MQIYYTSLEPKRGLGQGEDLSVLTAIKHIIPHAKSLYDIGLGVQKLSATAVTRAQAMIADFNSLQADLIFNASRVAPGDNETSEQVPLTSDFNIRSAQDPIGQTKATPDPKHHGQAMRSSICTEWIKSQNLKYKDFGAVANFKRLCPPPPVLRSVSHFVLKSVSAAQEVVYIRETLRNFGYPQSTATDVFEDNLACIALSENPMRRKFSRHIDIRRYFVRV